MYKTIISIISIIFIFNACAKTSSFDKKIVIKYYKQFNNGDIWLQHNEKHTFSKPIAKDKVAKEINDLPWDPWVNVFKVYYTNKHTYTQRIPIKAEQYQRPTGFSHIWEYDKLGRISKFITFYDTGNYIEEYTYKPNEKVVIRKQKNPTRHRPFKEKIEHFFYNDKHYLLKILTYHDGKLISIARPDKKNINIIHIYDLNNKRIDTWGEE